MEYYHILEKIKLVLKENCKDGILSRLLAKVIPLIGGVI